MATVSDVTNGIHRDGRTMKVQFGFLFLLFSLTRTNGQAGNNHTLINWEGQLLKDLMANYSVHVRPVDNISEPITVGLAINMLNIAGVHEKEEILETTVFMQQMWSDFRLKWNPLQYGGVSIIHIPRQLLWKPDITLYNNADIGMQTDEDVLAIVFPTGNVLSMPHARLRTRCSFDMAKFPFDTQTCVLKFGSWTYDGNRINVTYFMDNKEGAFDTSNIVTSREWSVVDKSATIIKKFYSCCPEPYLTFECTLTMRRNAVYYTHVFILPAVLMALLVPFQFVLPPECKERLTIGSTVLLGSVLLLIMLQDYLPEAHPTIPAIAMFYSLTMLWVTLSLVASIWIINTCKRGPRRGKVPMIIRQIFLKGLKRLVCLGDDSYYPLDEMESVSLRGLDRQIMNTENINRTLEVPSKGQLDRDVEEILKHVQTIAVRNTVVEARQEIHSEWHQVALVLDRVLCFLFTVTFLVYSFVLLA